MYVGNKLIHTGVRQLQLRHINNNGVYSVVYACQGSNRIFTAVKETKLPVRVEIHIDNINQLQVENTANVFSDVQQADIGNCGFVKGMITRDFNAGNSTIIDKDVEERYNKDRKSAGVKRYRVIRIEGNFTNDCLDSIQIDNMPVDVYAKSVKQLVAGNCAFIKGNVGYVHCENMLYISFGLKGSNNDLERKKAEEERKSEEERLDKLLSDWLG